MVRNHRALVQGTRGYLVGDIADRDTNCGSVVVAQEVPPIDRQEALEVGHSYLRTRSELSDAVEWKRALPEHKTHPPPPPGGPGGGA